MAFIGIATCKEKSTPNDLDSALQEIRTADALLLLVSKCEGADSLQLAEIAGRFAPFDFDGLKKSGPWQWDRPLIICVHDSIHCEMFSRLVERRWTRFECGTDSTHIRDVAKDLVRRWKRERKERMEEMFRK